MKSSKPRTKRLFVLGTLLLLPVLIAVLGNSQQVRAYSSYLTAVENQYPGTINSRIDNCQLCHPSGGYTLNAYAQDYANNGHSLTAIEQLDSDLDGYNNIVEINALTYPGDKNDHPAAQATNTPTRTAVPPTNTPTQTSVAPTSTPTRTAVAPTNTPTQTTVPPSATPTSTGMPPVATATVAAPKATATPTSTQIATATATATAAPTLTATPTVTPGAPAATQMATSVVHAGPTPTLIPLQSPANRMAFLGTVGSLPESSSRIGVWEVGNRKVYISAATWIEQKLLLHEHSQVWVLGSRRGESSVNAVYIRVLSVGEHDGGDGVRATPDSQSSDSRPQSDVASPVSDASAAPAGNR